MKKKFILFPVVGLLLYVLLSSYSTGPAAGGVDGTGATNPGGCNCHGPAGARSLSTSVALELDDPSAGGASVTSYIPGHVYTIKITGTNSTGLTWFGFQIGVIKTGTSGGGAINAGSFATTGLPASTHYVSTATSGLAIPFVEHSTPINSASPYTKSFSWTAPAAGTGSITIYGAVNAVNHNGGADVGDLWNNNSVAICEGVAAITAATTSVCPGSGITLSDATTGGTWSSGSTGVATVTSGGLVTGVIPGTAVISYNAGCSGIATTTVTVTSSLSAISGTLSVCQGATTPLTDGAGTWLSSNTGIATVGPTGIVSGVLTGSTSPATANITYTETSSGCTTTSTVTVNPLPASITGTSSVCQGGTTSLAETTTGGTWSSGNTGVATVTSGGTVGGVVTGNASPATAVITYTSLSGCARTITVTVNPLSPISGSTSICTGASTTLTDLSTGGTWTSSTTTVATIGLTSGSLTGGASPGGTSVITYVSPTGCTTATTVTVNTQPGSILGGPVSICPGSLISLSDAVTGGTWSSGNTVVASIGLTSGSLTGGASPGGTATITYSKNGCTASIVATVNASSPSIGGTTTICAGATTILTDVNTGGTWASSNTAVASIGLNSGFLTGATGAGGTTVITYTPPTGCPITGTITVTPLPQPITGTTVLCSGSTSALTDTGTGTWASGNTAVATVNGSGLTAGVGAGGTTTISYTSSGCAISTVITVNPLPPGIAGTTICPGATTTLVDGTTGGTWSSSNASVATIGLGTGLLTGGTATGNTATITYTSPLNCSITTTVTLNALPPAISVPAAAICGGASTTLSDGTTGGTWTSSNTSAATIGTTNGTVTGASGPGGTTLISYTAPTGCVTSTPITVNPLPSGITGNTSVCAGTTTVLSDATSGGTWSSSNTSAATVLPASPTVTGVAGVNTSTITYTLGTSCTATTVVTVNTLPQPITGIASLCIGLTSTLSDATSGGTWSSSNTAAATVISTSSVVTGAAPGNSVITYTLPTGCTAAKGVTVNPLPSIVSGNAPVCAGAIITLGNTTTGGTWSSDNTGIATIGSSSGTVTGVTGGTANIVYTIGAGCTATAVVTVNPLSPITGPTSVCTGLTALVADATSGGTWSSSNTGAAIVSSASGSVTAATPGNTLITYTLPTGCSATRTLTVVSTPSAITGTATVCVGSSTALTDLGGGTWTSSNTGIATVGSGNGAVFGVLGGTAVITYSLGTSCTVTAPVTVNALPEAISGVTHVCIGATTALTDTGGGTWSSSITTVATVDPGTGIVMGLTANTTIITYTLGNGCRNTVVVTINPLPALISGATSLCTGVTTALTDATTGGTWSSSSTGAVTVSTTGSITGSSIGTAIIVYTLPVTGCTTASTVTVNSLPSGISGGPGVCLGTTTSLTDGSGGGTWSSSNTGAATVGSSSGVVSGVLLGSSTITYSLGVGCTATKLITVNPLPSSISGPASGCAGATITLSEGTTGGTWSSSNTSIATMLPTSTIVNNVSPGIDTIFFTVTSTGCLKSLTITVNPVPATITGPANICLGTTVTLTDATSGGTWSSNNTLIASVSASTGIVNGLSPNTATITYKLSTGCLKTSVVTVNSLPSLITGLTSTCTGTTTTLGDVTTGGTWTSNNTAIATVVTGTSNIVGASPGLDTITYTAPTGCTRSITVTVNSAPSSITGVTNVCSGTSTILTDATSGGTWSSSSTTVASVGITTGAVTGGIITGTATITYRIASCNVTAVVTVNPAPALISGPFTVCAGSSTTLTDVTSAGIWTSSNTSTATVDATNGTVNGILPGTTTITYAVGSCSRSTIITVNPVPAAITGTGIVCVGSSISLVETSTGGTWSSGNTGIATVVPGSGAISGVSAGPVTVNYTLAGCSTSAIVTVNPLPAGISGATGVCLGLSATLSDATTGGTWSSGNTGIASVNSATGAVTGVSASSTVISYTIGTGCSVASPITVNPLPLAITGTLNVCAGIATVLSDGLGGGTWASSNTSVATATAGVGAGTISGIIPGTAAITYTLPTGCIINTTITVNATPGSITGTTSVCPGSTTALTDGTTGGTWSSGSTGIATVGATGNVSGVSTGTSVITYALGSGCNSHISVTVNAAPGAITGIMDVCKGLATALTDASGTGTWTSSATGIATVDGTGNVNAVSAGVATISFTSSSGCQATAPVTVNPLPAAIAGPGTVCVGETINLTDNTSGGIWSSSSNSVASVGAGTGIVTGVSEAIAIITYTLPTGCIATTTITDNCNVGVKQVINGINNVTLHPNPNTGNFTLSGSVSINDDEITVEVLDVVGQVVYTSIIKANNGAINEQISLNKDLANGTYLLSLRSGSERVTLRFVIDK